MGYPHLMWWNSFNTVLRCCPKPKEYSGSKYYINIKFGPVTWHNEIKWNHERDHAVFPYCNIWRCIQFSKFFWIIILSDFYIFLNYDLNRNILLRSLTDIVKIKAEIIWYFAAYRLYRRNCLGEFKQFW